MEGPIRSAPNGKQGPATSIPPLVEHPHSDFRSITGGYVYHGKRLPELKDAYIYGDYDTGRLWSLQYDGGQSHRPPRSSPTRNSASWNSPRTMRAKSTSSISSAVACTSSSPPRRRSPTTPFPRKLSETGLFASTKDEHAGQGTDSLLRQRPALVRRGGEGAVHRPPRRYADRVRRRHLSPRADLPRPRLAVPRRHGARQDVLARDGEGETGIDRAGWRPASCNIAKCPATTTSTGPSTGSATPTSGTTTRPTPSSPDAEGARPQTDHPRPQSHRRQTRANLALPEPGRMHPLPHDGGQIRLGITTLQMNKDHDYGGVIANQLTIFEKLGIFNKPPQTSRRTAATRRLPRPARRTSHRRARSYLHSNCAHCHRKWGGGNAEFELHATHPPHRYQSRRHPPRPRPFQPERPPHHRPRRPRPLDAPPPHGAHHVLGRMPHVASKVVDQPAVDLLRVARGS